jgi:hypothetical protein
MTGAVVDDETDARVERARDALLDRARLRVDRGNADDLSLAEVIADELAGLLLHLHLHLVNLHLLLLLLLHVLLLLLLRLLLRLLLLLPRIMLLLRCLPQWNAHTACAD